jgi:hypothetical protein
MKKSAKTIEIRVERTILAPLDEVFDGWLNPKIPGTPWNAAEKYILDPKVDGLGPILIVSPHDELPDVLTS